jgi:hypothetical protein
MVGGGTAGAGIKVLQTGVKGAAGRAALQALTGAATGAATASVSNEERVTNTAFGGVLGAIAPMLGFGAEAFKGTLRGGAKGIVNVLGSILQAGKGNAQGVIYNLSHAVSATGRAKVLTRAAAEAAEAAGKEAPGTRMAAVLATRAHETLATIVGQTRGQPALQVAHKLASDALEQGFSVVDDAIKWTPANTYRALATYSSKELAKFGEVGKQLSMYRNLSRNLLGVEDIDPEMVKRSFAALGTPAAETQRLIDLIGETADVEVKKSLLSILSSGIPRATGNVAGGAAMGGAGQADLRQDNFDPKDPT